MSETTALHPFRESDARDWVLALGGELDAATLVPADPGWAESLLERTRPALPRAAQKDEAAANRITFGFAAVLATRHPVFLMPNAALTQIESRIDRGLGMHMRPPSRLFLEAGMDPVVARSLPIRLDPAMSLMGGCWIPARLVPTVAAAVQQHEQRILRRMAEADLDPAPMYAQLRDTLTYCVANTLALYESVDVVTPGVRASVPPGARLVVPDAKRLDKAERKRLEELARPPKPEKEPSLLARMLKRGG